MSGNEPSYWRSAAEDEAMQDEHLFVWEAMVKSVEGDLAGRRVLDIGCNRGGFLRMLYDNRGIGEGLGTILPRRPSPTPAAWRAGDPCGSRRPGTSQ